MSQWFDRRALLLASQLDPGDRELARGRTQELRYMDVNRPSIIDTGSAGHVLIVTQERGTPTGSPITWPDHRRDAHTFRYKRFSPTGSRQLRRKRPRASRWPGRSLLP
jgi:hypothetical protein